MIDLKKYLKQDAVYWGTPVPDGYGGFSYASPVQLKVRWENRTTQFMSLAGEVSVSRAVVYSDADVSLDGYLMLGTLDDLNSDQLPQTQAGAFQVRGIDKIPDLSGRFFLRKIWL